MNFLFSKSHQFIHMIYLVLYFVYAHYCMSYLNLRHRALGLFNTSCCILCPIRPHQGALGVLVMPCFILCAFRPHQGALGVLYTSCDSVWRRTTLFLLLVSIFTIGLTILIIALFLALTVSFWLPRCAKKVTGIGFMIRGGAHGYYWCTHAWESIISTNTVSVVNIVCAVKTNMP